MKNKKINKLIAKLLSLIRKNNVADGENLAEENSKLTPIIIIGTAFTFIFMYIALTVLSNILCFSFSKFLNVEFFKSLFTGQSSTNYSLEFKQLFCSLKTWFISPNLIFFFISVVVTILVTFIAYKRLYARYRKLNYGQKGDNRLATIKEIQTQYKNIIDSKESFEGIGGVPVSHFKNKYYIDTNTVNSLILGTSRSGKGEMIIFPMIDNLSRAKEKSSMVLNDPKGELFSSSKDTLEKRGYEVQVLNLLDPMQSMSYNPLSLIIDSWKAKDYQRAQNLTNSFSHQMFDNPQAGANKWVYDSAKHMVNGLILGLVDYCDKNNQLDKVNLYNVSQMLVELNVKINSQTDQTYLDLFFERLPQGHMAKSQYASVGAASEKAKGSIIQTVIDGFQVFSMEDVAKMTSSNSFPLKSVGFPKYVSAQLDSKYYDKPISIKFFKDKKCIGGDIVKPNVEGILSLNFNCELDEDCIMSIYHISAEDGLRFTNRYSITIPQEDSKILGLELIDLDKANTKPDVVKSLDVHYSDKPLAVFMITPDYDKSKNMLTTTFVDQLYRVLMENASKTRGKKCFTRVHFILDEFGNMPQLTDLDTKLSVCLSRNVLFNLAVQSYSQLFSQYTSDIGQIVKENCQNHLVIKTLDIKTLEEISNKIGKKTVISANRSEKVLDVDTSNSVSASSENILTTERLDGLMEGEMVVLRSLHRKDLNGNRTRPFPIFNTKETKMPYRYQFLSDEFDTDIDINDIEVPSLHKYLNLSNNSVDFEKIIKDLKSKKQKSDSNKVEETVGKPRIGTNNLTNRSNQTNSDKDSEAKQNKYITAEEEKYIYELYIKFFSKEEVNKYIHDIKLGKSGLPTVREKLSSKDIKKLSEISDNIKKRKERGYEK